MTMTLDAAYVYKKQKGGLFKVSPKMQQHKLLRQLLEKIRYCVKYLDKLHPNRKLIRDLQEEEEEKKKKQKIEKTK